MQALRLAQGFAAAEVISLASALGASAMALAWRGRYLRLRCLGEVHWLSAALDSVRCDARQLRVAWRRGALDYCLATDGASVAMGIADRTPLRAPLLPWQRAALWRWAGWRGEVSAAPSVARQLLRAARQRMPRLARLADGVALRVCADDVHWYWLQRHRVLELLDDGRAIGHRADAVITADRVWWALPSNQGGLGARHIDLLPDRVYVAPIGSWQLAPDALLPYLAHL